MTQDASPGDRLDRRRLLTLLASWAGAVLVPGIVAINQPVVVAYVLWGIGFLGALIAFMAIARMTKTTDQWPWMVTSILPWLVDLAAPDNPMYIPVFVVAVGVFAAWIFLRSSATDRLLHEGLEGTGTVIEVVEPKASKAAINTGYVRRSVRLTVVHPDTEETYEAVLRNLFKADDLPKPGDEIRLRIDPEDAKRVAAVPVEKLEKPVEGASGEAETASDG